MVVAFVRLKPNHNGEDLEQEDLSRSNGKKPQYNVEAVRADEESGREVAKPSTP